MKIGILTIHHVLNYGAVWQAYSLAKVLADLGADVETIDYRPAVATEYYRQRIVRGRRLNVAGLLRQRQFSKFQKQYLPLGNIRCLNASDLAAVCSNYDAIVAGSDQIWCTSSGSYRGYDPNFFLNFALDQSIRRFSYAASAGNTTDFGEHREEIAVSLRKFDAISVRDTSTAALVKEGSGVEARLVLDPTLLHKFDEFESPPRNEMVVFAGNPQAFAGAARSILEKHKMRVVSMWGRCDYADESLKVVSPVEWLRRIKSARVVLTDFFHGLALSTRFCRPFLVNAPKGKVVKIGGLLQQLNLSAFNLAGGSDSTGAVIRALEAPGDHAASIAERLKAEERKSMDYLRSILEREGVERIAVSDPGMFLVSKVARH